MAEVVLASQRVLPRRATELGYRFRFTDVGQAVGELLG
jgi:NAD dependent epimerase/dehydratase family enzyme